MGISHPLSDEFGGGGGMLLMPQPSSPLAPESCCSAVDDQDDFLEHEVSRMDTLAGIAIKYGVEELGLEGNEQVRDKLLNIGQENHVQPHRRDGKDGATIRISSSKSPLAENKS